MCVITAALLAASGGSDDTNVLNGPPSNGRQQAGCELAVICASGHGAVASASAETGVTSPAMDAATAATTAAVAGILPDWNLARRTLSIGGKARPTRPVPQPARTRHDNCPVAELGPIGGEATQSHICTTGGNVFLTHSTRE